MARRGSYAKGIAKREEILTAALDVIARDGYGRASVRELADAVGLSQAGLLHYFSSKEELFAEILRRRDEVDAATFIDDAGSDDPTALMREYPGLVRHNADVPGLVQLYARLSADATDPEHPAHAFFADRNRRFRAFAAEGVRAAQASGSLPDDLDPQRVATMLMALADGLQTQWLMDPELDMSAHVAEFLAILGRRA